MIKRIEPSAAADALKRETNSILLDVREQWEFDLAHIENSVFVPLRILSTKIDELKQYDKIYVICHHGFRSLSACEFLSQAGIREVYNVEGGIERWAD